ncbi:uncharacterized protein BJ171DRAFT_474004 [Polychytrium aggregatum]|uniref:uncharacterized protein n=1 Tax=Polychytrium aggregatum TaxID=110093 RepID=UPI0022FE3F5C|nr:uncharacterized protein BJ171DRAFT_474004 [Polychytrium aggregatum]KAI9205488.1 hypothetical protein BJ171DRAFT_474004 [Polychytrium aggregatum]
MSLSSGRVYQWGSTSDLVEGADGSKLASTSIDDLLSDNFPSSVSHFLHSLQHVSAHSYGLAHRYITNIDDIVSREVYNLIRVPEWEPDNLALAVVILVRWSLAAFFGITATTLFKTAIDMAWHLLSYIHTLVQINILTAISVVLIVKSVQYFSMFILSQESQWNLRYILVGGEVLVVAVLGLSVQWWIDHPSSIFSIF